MLSRSCLLSAAFVLVVLIIAPQPGAAQVPGGAPESELKPLQAKAELTEEDRTAIRNYIGRHMPALAGREAEPAQEATTALRVGLEGSEPFRRFFAATVIESINSAYKKADLAQATRMIALVSTLDTPDALPLLLEALQDERVGVRAAAAVGLRTLRPKLVAAGRDTVQRVLNALRDAGKREKSRQALVTIYSALNYAELPSPPDPKPQISALLDLLDERAAQYARGSEISALGADDAGLRMARALLPGMEANERRRLTIAAATMMQRAVERYASAAYTFAKTRDSETGRAAAELRNGLERLMLVGEETLTALMTPEKAPNVGDALRRVKPADLVTEWNAWAALLRAAVNQDFNVTTVPQEEEAPAAGGSETAAEDSKARK